MRGARPARSARRPDDAAVVVVGVDGCPAGWVAVRVDLVAGGWSATVHRSFAELLASHRDAAAIGVDIPIGLAETGPRACDRAARARLGPRRSSVFNPPTRRLLAAIGDAPTYRAANALAWRDLGHGIGVQAYNIFAKIREVDAAIGPELQSRVREVHPELCFAAMRGRPCTHGKKSPAGAVERLEALQASCAWLGGQPSRPPRGAARDDLLDALAVAWTAERVAGGAAEALPVEPEIDRRGLRMEMVT
jgi:predicted RNase H-like nuclease